MRLVYAHLLQCQAGAQQPSFSPTLDASAPPPLPLASWLAAQLEPCTLGDQIPAVL